MESFGGGRDIKIIIVKIYSVYYVVFYVFYLFNFYIDFLRRCYFYFYVVDKKLRFKKVESFI